MNTKYEVRAAHTQEDVFNHQCVVVEGCDTIVEAKRQAKYVLTDDFQHSAELHAPLSYSQVINSKDECLYDFFR